MEITKLAWKDHPVLSHLNLYLTNEQNRPYKTIVLAGENGTGKTSILNSILNIYTPFEDMGGDIYAIEHEHDGSRRQFIRDNSTASGYRAFDTPNYKQFVDPQTHPQSSYDISIARLLKPANCIFSRARSGFSTKQIKSSGTIQLDSKQNLNDFTRDESDDYTSIKQLLVDISAQDHSDWYKLSQRGSRMTFEEFENQSRLSRFRLAFNAFFDDLQFVGVDESSQSQKRILFEKNGHSIDIESLSTGELQIVFRGSYLLRNQKLFDQGVALVDEPELSMHPKWQRKILDYYRSLFSINQKQFAQLFIATHSEHVIEAALNHPDDTLVVVLKNEAGDVTATPITRPMILPSLSSAEINYQAFGIPTSDFHIALYAEYANKKSTPSIKACDNAIANETLYDANIFERIDDSSGTRYQTLPTYIRNAIHHPDSGRMFTEQELEKSIRFLCKLLE